MSGRQLLASRKTADALVALVGAVLFFSTAGAESMNIAIPVWIVVEALYCLASVWRNRLLLVVYGVMAYAVYSICYANYLHPIETVFATYSGSAEALLAMRILLLFYSLLVLFLPQKVEPYGKGANAFALAKADVVPVLVLAIVAALLLIGYFGFDRPAELGAERGKPTSIYEYSIILFIAGFFLAGSNRALRWALAVVAVLFIGQELAYGGRVIAIQLIAVVFFFLVSEKMSRAQLVVCCLLAGFFFLSYGGIRTALWNEGIGGLLDSFSFYLGRGLTWDTAYSAWHTGITFFLYDHLITPDEHAQLLLNWLASLLCGSSAIPNSNLPVLTHEYFSHYGGGVLPAYGFFYMGYFGVLFFSLLVALPVQIIGEKAFRKPAGNVWAAAGKAALLYFVVTTPRWFLYSPLQITRGVLLCFLVCVSLFWLSSLMSASRKVSRAKHAKRTYAR